MYAPFLEVSTAEAKSPISPQQVPTSDLKLLSASVMMHLTWQMTLKLPLPVAGSGLLVISVCDSYDVSK